VYAHEPALPSTVEVVVLTEAMKSLNCDDDDGAEPTTFGVVEGAPPGTLLEES
jgi:hypothetical protein